MWLMQQDRVWPHRSDTHRDARPSACGAKRHLGALRRIVALAAGATAHRHGGRRRPPLGDQVGIRTARSPHDGLAEAGECPRQRIDADHFEYLPDGARKPRGAPVFQVVPIMFAELVGRSAPFAGCAPVAPATAALPFVPRLCELVVELGNGMLRCRCHRAVPIGRPHNELGNPAAHEIRLRSPCKRLQHKARGPDDMTGRAVSPN